MITVDLLLSQAIEGFLIARRAERYSPETLLQYHWGLKFLLDRTGDKPIQSVNLDDLRGCMAYLYTEYRPAFSGGSLFAIWKSIKAFYKWLYAEFDLPRVDSSLIRPVFEYSEIVPFTQSEIAQLIAVAEYSSLAKTTKRKPFKMRRPTGYRDKAIILTLLDTGLRVSELARLKIEDLNLQACELYVQPYLSSRKSKPRTIPLGTGAVKAIWRYLTTRSKASSDESLFMTTGHRAMNRDNIRQLLVGLATRATVSHCYPHRFRHTFAIQFLRNGGDLVTLKRLLGHTTLKMSERYLAIASIDVKNAHRRASPVDNWHL